MNRKQQRAKLRAARARQQRRHAARTAIARRESEQLPTVEGEDPWEILRALAQMQQEQADDDDMSRLSIELPGQEMAPLARAFMRVEAELLIEDAALLTSMDDEQRSDDQRRFDALMLVVDRTCVAIEAQSHHDRVEL